MELRLVTAAAGSILWLDTGSGFLESRRLDRSYNWVKFPRLDTSLNKAESILRPTRVPAAKTDSILRLTTNCGWFYSEADSTQPARLDLRLTYTLIYQVILRTYSAKYIIFIVCFLPTDFSYHWSKLWLLLQEPWRSLRKLEETWRRFKALAATDSSCRGRFQLRRLIRDLRPINNLENLTPMPPIYETSYMKWNCEYQDLKGILH